MERLAYLGTCVDLRGCSSACYMVRGSFFSQHLVVLLGRAREDGNGAGLEPHSFLSPPCRLVLWTRERSLSQGKAGFYTEAHDFPSLLRKMSNIILIFSHWSTFFWAGSVPICLAELSSEHWEQIQIRTSSPGILPNRF